MNRGDPIHRFELIDQLVISPERMSIGRLRLIEFELVGEEKQRRVAVQFEDGTYEI
jgi:hypothetical protein